MSTIKYNILLAGLFSSRCSFSNFPDCNFPLSYLYLIISILVSIPYSYVLTVTLRQERLLYFKKRDKCVIFCTISLINNLFFAIIYCSLTHAFINFGFSYMNVLQLTIRLLQAFCFALTFSEIAKILTIFRLKGSKIIYYLTISLIILIGVLSFLVYINYFISYDSKFFLYLNKIIQSKLIIYHTIIIIYIISFATLSIAFIFSNIKNFIEPERRNTLNITLFLMPIPLFLYIIQFYIYGSIYWRSKYYYIFKSTQYIDDFPKYKSKYFYFLWAYSSFYFGLMNLIPLAILNILSGQTDDNQESEKSSENTINSDITISI